MDNYEELFELVCNIFKDDLCIYDNSYSKENDSVGYTEYWGFGGYDNQPDYIAGTIDIQIPFDLILKYNIDTETFYQFITENWNELWSEELRFELDDLIYNSNCEIDDNGPTFKLKEDYIKIHIDYTGDIND